MRIDCINWCRAGYMTSENGLFSFADCVMSPKAKGELKKLAFYMDGQLWEARWTDKGETLVIRTNDYFIEDADEIVEKFKRNVRLAGVDENGDEVAAVESVKVFGESCEITFTFCTNGEN